MNLDTIFRHLPDGVLCRELKLLYVSGRLFEVLEGRDLDKMPLTKIEKMFLRWAIKQWKKSEEAKLYSQKREAMKLWATKVAITGENCEKPYVPHLTHPTFSIPDSSYIPPSIRANVGEVGVAVQNTRGTKDCSEVFQAYEEYNREKKKAEDFK
jgi:hypothetical protein